MFGIGQGPSAGQTSSAGLLGSQATFATSSGENDILKSQNFWSAILSGDPTKISSVLGPQMSAINKQNQQRKMTAAQFGDRGGGTNATMANLDTNTTAQINDMIASLTGSAASSLGSMGGSLLNTGVQAGTASFDAQSQIQKENAAKWNDIFSSIGDIAGVIGGFGAPGSILRKVGQGVGGVLQG